MYPESFYKDLRGPYTVFFHECGYGIDDVTYEAVSDENLAKVYEYFPEASKGLDAYTQALGEVK